MSESEADASGLISVKTELVHQFVIGGILEGVKQRYQQPLPAAAEAALERSREALAGSDHEEPPGDDLATAVAQAGYLARMVEGEMFEPARQPSPYVEEKLREAGDASADGTSIGSQVALDLARQEPVERPDPDHRLAASWRIPGPGGHVRHYVALETAEWLSQPPEQGGRADLGPEVLKRCWMYGFFLRCCEEAAAPAA